MALQDDLNRLQKQLGNFFFPRKCPFCGAVTGGRLLCGKGLFRCQIGVVGTGISGLGCLLGSQGGTCGMVGALLCGICGSLGPLGVGIGTSSRCFCLLRGI